MSTSKKQAQRAARIAEITAAAEQLKALYAQWVAAQEQATAPKRVLNRMEKETTRLMLEIYNGALDRVQERFHEVVEEVRLSTQPKKRVSYGKMLAALGELVDLNTHWQAMQPRSQAECTRQRRFLRRFLREIEAGHINHLTERFHQAQSEENSASVPAEVQDSSEEI